MQIKEAFWQARNDKSKSRKAMILGKQPSSRTYKPSSPIFPTGRMAAPPLKISTISCNFKL